MNPIEHSLLHISCCQMVKLWSNLGTWEKSFYQYLLSYVENTTWTTRLCSCIAPCHSWSTLLSSEGTMSTSTQVTNPDRLLVQIASYNTNLQGPLGLPQDLVDWLSPTLQVSSFLSRERRAPDVVAVGFQELLPLHLGRMFIYLFCLVLCLNWPRFSRSLWIVQVCDQ
jgi:hypothetical protein